MSSARTRTLSFSLLFPIYGLVCVACGSGTPAATHANSRAASPKAAGVGASDVTGSGGTEVATTESATTEAATTESATTEAATTEAATQATTQAATSEGPDTQTPGETATTGTAKTTTGPKATTGGTGGSQPGPITGPVNIVILRENGVGSAAQAQRYVDELVARTGEVNNWTKTSGKYTTRRAQAESYIASSKPQFGILSLGGFLALRATNKFQVVGQADVKAAGGQKYFIVSASAADLAGCKGKTLASNHLGDTKMIEGVVAAGAFKLADFTVEKTRRPVQTLKKVIAGEAVCALIDDAQKSDLGSVDGGNSLKVVWTSAKMPPMVVVAFGSAKSATRQRFKANLGKVCSGDGKSTCGQAGIRSLKSASNASYRAAIKAYGG
ncbi:MAG: hypothetical protein ACPG4T_02725 [Nannocystaceae bacterium]